LDFLLTSQSKKLYVERTKTDWTSKVKFNSYADIDVVKIYRVGWERPFMIEHKDRT
jgi:hypothetical protein